MNNQKAIEILREKVSPCVTGEWKEAIGMAISALEAQDAPDTNVDTISRTAAIEEMHNIVKQTKKGFWEPAYIPCVDVFTALKQLPSAQPLVIHCTDCEDWHERQSILGFAISELPSAQSEIIHCRDCKNWDKTWINNFSPDYHYCPMVDGVRKDNFYCADAERREE